MTPRSGRAGSAGSAADPAGGRRRRRWGTAVAVCLGAAALAGLIAYMVTPRPAAVVGGAVTGGTGSTPSDSPGAGLAALPTGRTAPGFSLPRLGGGKPVSLAAEGGHPVVLNFFASWCPHCRQELSAFATVSGGGSGPVRFLAVDTNDHNPALASRLLRKAGDHYPVGVDPAARVANGKYLVQALPATVFIDANGRIAGEVFGAQTVRSLRPWIRALTKSAKS